MLTPTVRIQTFPNEEVRAVFYYAREKKDNNTPVNGSDSETPLDIIQKLKTLPSDSDLCLDKDSPGDSPKVGYGRPGEGNGFSVNGRRRLLRAGATMDLLVDEPRQILFATGTLPGSTYEAKLAIAAWSGWAVNAIKAWFAKRIPSKVDMYVWEFQARGALHLHYAVICRSESTRKWIISNWKKQWERIIDGIGKRAGVDMWRKNANYTHALNKEVLQADIQECTKSVGRYLAKYVGKSQQQYIDNHWKKCKPSRFWGISRPLCAELASRTQSVEHVFKNRMEMAAAYEDCLSVMQSDCLLEYHYDIAKVSARVVVGYSNQGERSWVLNRIRTQLSLKEKSFMSSESERDKLCILIGQCLNRYRELREVVELNSGSSSLAQATTTALSESESSDMKDLLILDFRWYIYQLIQTRPCLPDGLKRLHKRIVIYCKSNMASYCSQIAVPLVANPEPRKSEKSVYSQLTLW